MYIRFKIPRGTFVPYANAQANVIFCRKAGRPKRYGFTTADQIFQAAQRKTVLLLQKCLKILKMLWQRPKWNKQTNDEGEEGRFRAFFIEEIKERNYKLDIKWLKDDTWMIQMIT